MRTSRVSRDTARIASAITGRRASQRLRTSNAITATAGDAVTLSKDTESVRNDEGTTYGASSDSDLSSAPEDPDWDSIHAVAGGKRKRGSGSTVATVQQSDSTKVSISETASLKKATAKAKKARRVPAKRVVGANGTVKVEPPPHWEEMYALTREMRNENVAPVDTMGCESLADRTRSPRDQRFQTLISLMLSSQTKDTVTSAAIKGMQANMPGGFNLESVLALEPSELNSFINKVGFHNLKTKYIKAAAEILRDKWNSDIPDTIEGLVSLPGVGPKMAYLCMSGAWGRDEGIGVDVHVHRITNLWGWHKTKQPEETRAALESWLPKDRWHDINNLLVGFGQTVCLPVGRKCGECKLADRGLCPSALVTKSTKVKKEEILIEHDADNGRRPTARHPSVSVKLEQVRAEDAKSSIPDIEDIGKGNP